MVLSENAKLVLKKRYLLKDASGTVIETPEEMVKRQTEQMTNDLGLNAEQTKKVEALNKKYSEKMRMF